MKLPISLLFAVTLLAACTTTDKYNPLTEYMEVEAETNLDMPTPENVAADEQKLVARGEYLVELLGCGACHTEGALVGRTDVSKLLAGSHVGIAYTTPFENDRPGIVFPRNLTPDPETGLGDWSDTEIANAIQAGAGQHGASRILVMPWQRYARIASDDVTAIVRYLKSLEPVKNRVPAPVAEGSSTRHMFVHFGVYVSRDLL